MKRALLIDDDEALLEVLSRTLAGLDHSCDHATTELEARRLLANNDYDVIMVDLCMDEGHFTRERHCFCDQLKSGGGGARIIGMTGCYLTHQQIVELAHSCLDEFLDKNSRLLDYEALRTALESKIVTAARKPYNVALSYSRDHANWVRPIADLLRLEYGRRGVFFDQFHLEELAGTNADLYLHRVFRKLADVVVVFLSRDYGSKSWCQREWAAIRSVMGSPTGPDIIPIRVAPGDVSGFFEENDIYLDATNMPPEEVARIITYRTNNSQIR
jgi:CheY-like chemotaxis protein